MIRFREAVWRIVYGLRLHGSRAERVLHSPDTESFRVESSFGLCSCTSPAVSRLNVHPQNTFSKVLLGNALLEPLSANS